MVWKYLIEKVQSFTLNTKRIAVVAIILGVVELFLSLFIINRVKYTEIDWETYMTHVTLVKNGEYDYTKITGSTGPCVYPAGFLYIYLVLYNLTNHGKNIFLAQYIFSVFYIINFLLVMNFYRKSQKVPPFALMLLTFTSYRIHSIFILRLFNDPIAILFLHLAINFLVYRKYTIATIIFSLALSIKMNILLYLPGFGIILILAMGMGYAFLHGLIIILVQILIGLPFLLHDARAYLSRAFQFDRLFEYKWTVNWRFVPEDIFLDKRFHALLLLLHLTVLAYFVLFKWIRNYGGLRVFFTFTANRTVDPNRALYILFTSNFVGIVFSRTLHYQFYVWYYYGLPFLLWAACGDPPLIGARNIKLLLWGLIEYSWNTFPSTNRSSLALNVCHWIVLLGLLIMPQNYEASTGTNKIKREKLLEVMDTLLKTKVLSEEDAAKAIIHKRKKFYP